MKDDNNEKFLIDIYGDRLVSEKSDVKTSLNPIYILSNILNQILHQNTWNKLFDWCRNDLTTIVLLISGIGSVIQIYHLAKINLSYVKFFSITQLVADGSLVFLTMVTVAVIYRILKPLFDYIHINASLVIGQKKYPIENVFLIWMMVIFSIFYPFYLMDLAYKIPIEWLWVAPVWSTILVSIHFVIIFFMFNYIRSYYYYFKSSSNNFKFKKLSILASNIVLASFLVGSSYFSTKVIYVYLEAYGIPYTAINYRNVKEKVKADYGELDSYQLLYFNDLYLFVEIKMKGSENKTKVIYKTEDALF